MLPNAEGDQTTPSVVAFAPGEAPGLATVTVGSAARECARMQLSLAGTCAHPEVATLQGGCQAARLELLLSQALHRAEV